MPNPKPKKGSGAPPTAAPKARSKKPAPRAKAGRIAAARKGAKNGALSGARRAVKKAVPAKASRTATPRTTARPRGRASALPIPPPPTPPPGLSDEEQILQAKYLPRELPPRLFEEERFLFPESYEVDRVRLLVKDPEWVFAYWDVNPQSLSSLGRAVGERAMALSRLTLRVSDPQHGGSTDVLLPEGARWWYVRTDTSARSYRAALGITLPSGEFKLLAESNTVTSPRLGPSPARARRRVSAHGGTASAETVAVDDEPSVADEDTGDEVGPWNPKAADVSGEGPKHGGPERAIRGASDAFRPGGASDAYRR